MTDGHSMSGMEDKIEAGSPLRLLDLSSREPVKETSKRLCALYDGWREEDVAWMLKTCLLQAHYNLPNQLVEDHFRYHELFNWFVCNGNKSLRFDNARYQIFLSKVLEDLELKKFFKEVVLNLGELRMSDVEAEQALELMKKLVDWAQTNSARVVYFGQYENSPLRSIVFSFNFENANLTSKPFQALAKSFCPDDESSDYKRMRRNFENRDEQPFDLEEGELEERIDQDSEDPYEEEYDEEDMVELSYNEGERRLYIQGNSFLQMEVNPEKFDSWEDTVRPFAQEIIDTCKRPKSVVDNIYLYFENTFKLPSEADITEYFFMIPTLPPQITPPAFMREQNHAYYLPQRAMKGSYKTDLLYDSFGQYLTVDLSFKPQDEYLEVSLKLSTHWTDRLHIDSAMEQLDTMKTNLNAAFHSIIRDKARMLFS